MYCTATDDGKYYLCSVCRSLGTALIRSLTWDSKTSESTSWQMTKNLSLAISAGSSISENYTQVLSLILNMWLIWHGQQECIPVGCVPPACWPYPVVSHVSRGGLSNPLPGCKPPRMQTPLEEADSPGHVTSDSGKPHPPSRGQTNTCEIITLPQTSFAAGKNFFRKKAIFTHSLPA